MPAAGRRQDGGAETGKREERWREEAWREQGDQNGSFRSAATPDLWGVKPPREPRRLGLGSSWPGKRAGGAPGGGPGAPLPSHRGRPLHLAAPEFHPLTGSPRFPWDRSAALASQLSLRSSREPQLIQPDVGTTLEGTEPLGHGADATSRLTVCEQGSPRTGGPAGM